MSGSNSQQNGFIVDMSKWNLNDPLQSVDPEIYGLIKDEKDRQRKGLEMIASENFTYTAILDCLGSCLHNKYSEGQPGARYKFFQGKIHIFSEEFFCTLYGTNKF